MTRERFVQLLVAATVLALTLSSCGGEPTFPQGSIGIVANSDIAVGPNSRVQIGLVGPTGERLGSPDTPIRVEIQPADESVAAKTYDAEWLWLIPDVTGLYRIDADISVPGVWRLTVMPESGDALPDVGFQARRPTIAPDIGAPAPVAPIDTLATKALEDLTTDPDPDPDLYQLTMEEAFTSGRPTVVVFSTPAFCQSATCGPTLDTVKSVKSEFPEVNFMHVEVYTDINAPGFTPGPEFLAPALGPDYWNLPTEPWVFVVDMSGLVIARFEGSLTPDDLREALA